MPTTDLFTPMSRDERQEESRKKWIKSGCKGVIEAATGYGKTRVALNCLTSFSRVFPDRKVLVVVPTETLKNQWLDALMKRDLLFNSDVQIINTAIKSKQRCDILIIDEIHRVAADTFKRIFDNVYYNAVLGLTATLERLDGKHTIIEKYCPIVDSISLGEALANNWVSQYTEYRVILDVNNIDEYEKINKEFISHFEFFGCNFDLVMSMVGKDGYKRRIAYRDLICKDPTKKSQVLKDITYHSVGFMQTLQKRKKFINHHPDKVRVAREIIKWRPNAKIITFSSTVEMAESIGVGYVYTGKTSKKKGRTTIEEFSLMPSGVLNTVKKADEGLDCPGLSVAIILGMDSSQTRSIQRKG